MPGLAKTLLVSTLGQILDVQFKRIQFTPDLMPSDITGTEILEEDDTTGRREFRFVQGPVFTNILLADEINRTPPKTQAALLEAMQERQVTVGGSRPIRLPEPFFVMATQNPIEQEGTYPLPEAQLDRFMFNVKVDYPTLEHEEGDPLRTTTGEKPDIRKVLSSKSILYLGKADSPDRSDAAHHQLRREAGARHPSARSFVAQVHQGNDRLGSRAAGRPIFDCRRQSRGRHGRPTERRRSRMFAKSPCRCCGTASRRTSNLKPRG